MVNKSTNGMNHFQNNIADNQVRAGKGGAIEVILNVMRTHSNNAGVCEYGCDALCIITANGNFFHVSLTFISIFQFNSREQSQTEEVKRG